MNQVIHLALLMIFVATFSVPFYGTQSTQAARRQDKSRKQTARPGVARLSRTRPQVQRVELDILPASKSLSTRGGAAHPLNFQVDARAIRFAPIVFHDKDEKNFPTNVDWFLDRTSMWFKDKNCDVCLYKGREDNRHDACKYSAPLNQSFLHHGRPSECGEGDDDSYERPDREKKRTFYFKDVAPQHKGGHPDQSGWITYVHIYSNAENAPIGPGGTTIQYWRFYAHNGKAPEHGGDWEGIHVVLDRDDVPQAVRLLGHTGISFKRWGEMRREGDHPKIYSEKGGHASMHEGAENGRRHNTWETGGLLDVGDRTWAYTGEYFIYYSGLWGSIGTGLIPGKGYWGPAFNETEERPNGFITAWCEGRADATDAECNRNYRAPN